jgi:hypothetical protein
MKPHSGVLMVIFLICAGAAGWCAAHIKSAHLELTDEERAVQRQTSAVVSWVSAELVSTDRITLEYRNRPSAELLNQKKVALLINALRSSTYKRTPPGLWISEPSFELYRGGRKLVELQLLGSTVRIIGTSIDGDYLVSTELSTVLSELVSKRPDQVLEPASIEVTPRAGPHVAPALGVAHL